MDSIQRTGRTGEALDSIGGSQKTGGRAHFTVNTDEAAPLGRIVHLIATKNATLSALRVFCKLILLRQ